MSDSTCPDNENSTDCLLRLVLRTLETQGATEDAKFDWDPITFAFTVPIGIFAVLFALITIYQAILAGGLGRRKSNRRAIGNWADKVRKVWSWHDLNRLSIATTPVLRSEQILEILRAKSKRPETGSGGNERNEREAAIGPFSSVNKILTQATAATVGMGDNEPPAATWLHFLEHIGLQDLGSTDDGVDTKTTMADYLPADLLAVPAYAEVSLIVAMAAVSGAHSFKSLADAQQSPYPVIVGDDFQFDFRQHPTLGIIGAFSRYGNRQTVHIPSRLLREQLVSAIEHARGNISTVQSVFGTPGASSREHDFKQATIAISQSIYGPEVAIHLKHDCVAQKSPCLLQSSPPRDDKHHLFWLLVADTPRRLPAIFPAKMSSITSNVLTMLALNSKFWSSPRTYDLDSGNPTCIPGLDHRLPLPFIGWQWISRREIPQVFPEQLKADDLKFMLKLIDMDTEVEQICLDKNDGVKDFLARASREEKISLGFEDVIQRCQTFLHGFEEFQAWFESMDPLQKQYFRGLVLLQLQQLDSWLRPLFKDNSGWRCRTGTLYYSTLALLDTEKAISENKFDCPQLVSPQRDRWLSLNMAWASKRHIPARHYETLRTLDVFLSLFPLSEEGNTAKYKRIQYRRQIACLLGSQNPANHGPRAVSELFLRLKHIIQALYQLCEREYGRRNDESDQVSESGLDSHNDGVSSLVAESGCGSDDEVETVPRNAYLEDEPVMESEQEEQDDPLTEDPVAEELRAEESINNALIWRAILIAMIYYTAPDSSAILTSGIWKHIIPVI